jgi:hypothetical protein
MRKYFEPNGFRQEKSSYRRLHRCRKNIEFIEICLRHKVIPKFARLSYKKAQHLTPQDIENSQQKYLRTELQNQRILLLNCENSFNILSENLRKTCKTSFEYDSHLNLILSSVTQNERFDDRKRSQKLDRLLSEFNQNYNKAQLHNFTPLTIPMEVASFLQMGKNYCVGGSSRGSNNYVEIQNIFMKFRDYCRNLKIDEAIIENVRCHSVLITQDLESTYTYDKRIGQLLSFMRQNPEIVIINVDKSVDVAILLKKDYHGKLSEL